MSKEKQSRADLQDKKIQALIAVVQRILDENAYIKDLAVGTLETIKLMPGYEEAIEQLLESQREESTVKQMADLTESNQSE
tara:strand:+ start:149 stop:391 length:243 start_codon:yes stop_codon:yes gene_type:complete